MRPTCATVRRTVSIVTLLSVPVLLTTGGCGGLATEDRELVPGRIIYTTNLDGNFEIYSMDADGSGRVNLTNNPAMDTEAAASYDGTRIAFTSDRAGTGNLQLYTMNATGSGLSRLMTTAANDQGPNWLWSNFMAFSSDRVGGRMHIFTMNPDGTNVKQITTGASDNFEPCLGNISIVFQSRRDGNPEIYIVGTNGSGLTRLTNNPAQDLQPYLAPNGQKVLFSSNRSGEFHIYSMDRDGTNVVQLTTTGAPNFKPIVSIDSQQVAFTSERHSPNRGSEVFVMNIEGTNERQITFASARCIANSWPGK